MNTQPLQMLLVDDHQMLIDGIKLLLQNEADIHIVAEAHNGLEALEILNTKTIDFVITDISMPQMSGIELTRKIKDLYPEIKILVLTMFNDREIINEIIEAEADGYILKNTGKQELLDAIRKIADNGTYFSKEIMPLILEKTYKQKEKKIFEDTTELTNREIEILKLICQEYSSANIAEKLCISQHTVETHRKHIIQKTKTKTIVGLIRFAIERNIA